MRNESGVIGGAMAPVMAPAMGETQDEKEKTMNTQLKSGSIIQTIGQGTAKRYARGGMIGVTLVVLIAAALAMSQTFIHRSSGASTHSGTTTQQRRFLEVNTTWLADSVAADVAPTTVPFSRMRFLEVNTMLGLTADAAPVALPRSTQWFREVNTNLGMGASPATPAYPYGEAVTPMIGKRR